MKTTKSILKEKSNEYGLKALTDAEILTLLNFKGENYYTSDVCRLHAEMMRRKEIQEQFKIRTSNDIYTRMAFLEGVEKEQFFVLFLRRNNSIIKDSLHSSGGSIGTVVDIKAILREALECKAQAIVLVHNHPSGEMKPSGADLTITKNVRTAAHTMELKLLDHVIIGNGQCFKKYYSMADEGDI